MGFCSNCGADYEQHTIRESAKPTMMDAYVSMWKNYSKFSGRARRSEYWYVCLANVIISLIFSLGSALISEIFFYYVSVAYSLVTFIPQLSLSVRRLHDIGKSGHTLWLLFTMIVPIVNIVISIMLIVFCCKDSDKCPNKYGEGNKYYCN